MSIVAWVALGLVGGAVAGWLWGLRGRALLSDVVVGGLGALLGGFITALTLGVNIADFDATSTLVAGVGAALLIVVLNTLPATDVYD